MNRRALLTAGVAAWLAPSLAFAGVDPRERRRLLNEAWDRAVAARRALLVVVIPADEDTWYERGRSLGVWLEHASTGDLARLDAVEAVCVTLAELARLVPGVAAAEEPWFVLVRVDLPTPTFRSVVVPRPTVEPMPDFEVWAADPENARHPERMLRFVYQAEAADADAAYAHAVVVAYRGAVIRMLVAESLGRGTAARGRARWVEAAPPGAHWGRDGGCGGAIYEGVPRMSRISCGMGAMSRPAGRFLAFWDVVGGA